MFRGVRVRRSPISACPIGIVSLGKHGIWPIEVTIRMQPASMGMQIAAYPARKHPIRIFEKDNLQMSNPFNMVEKEGVASAAADTQPADWPAFH